MNHKIPWDLTRPNRVQNLEKSGPPKNLTSQMVVVSKLMICHGIPILNKNHPKTQIQDHQSPGFFCTSRPKNPVHLYVPKELGNWSDWNPILPRISDVSTSNPHQKNAKLPTCWYIIIYHIYWVSEVYLGVYNHQLNKSTPPKKSGETRHFDSNYTSYFVAAPGTTLRRLTAFSEQVDHAVMDVQVYIP